MIDVKQYPEHLLTVQQDDHVLYGEQEMVVSFLPVHQGEDEQKIYLTTVESDVAGYNDLVWQYHRGEIDIYPQYKVMIKHLRVGYPCAMCRHEMVEAIRNGLAVIG